MDGLLQTKGYLREFTSGTRWWTVSEEDEEEEDTILKYGDFIGKLLGSPCEEAVDSWHEQYSSRTKWIVH